MKFEENKVVSAFNMHDVQLKDLGWFGNTRKELKMKVETEKPLQLIARDFTLAHIFQSEEGGRSIFFYPAPYEYLQAQWVKENDLKVGDKVRVVRMWELGKGDRGAYAVPTQDTTIGSVFEVTKISRRWIDTNTVLLPYFAIEKVEHEYRPFNMEEFAIYRNRWWVHKETGDKVRFDQYCEDGLLNTFRGLLTWQELLDEFTDEQDNPAGIKL